MLFPRWLTRRPDSRPASGRKVRRGAATFRPSLECLEDRWVPATLAVTKGADLLIDNVPQHGNLRRAVDNARDGDTILLTPAIAASPITLRSPLDLDHDVTIEAKGPIPATISGGGLSGVFIVSNHVTLSNLVITGGGGRGYYNGSGFGGAIFNQGTLTLSGCTLSDNSAEFSGGAIYNTRGATLTLSDCTLSGNSAPEGGGIYNLGTLTIRDSTLSGNSATQGGGLANFGTLTVRGSTLLGNTAPVGGDFYNAGLVLLFDGTVGDRYDV